MPDAAERRAARDAILGRLRTALGRDPSNREAGLADVRRALTDDRLPDRPPAPADLVARFRREAQCMSSTVAEIASMRDLPAAVAAYLESLGLPTQGVVWPSLAHLDWRRAGLDLQPRAAGDGDLVGVTGCFCAIAETGTVMSCSAPDEPAATSLLPETHVVAVPMSRIVFGMEEAWTLLRQNHGDILPRAVNLISGLSRTGDIEMTIVLGAHGPYRVHILLVADA
ncbi:LutC/YkgG family protein [Rhodocyclaceae bacterium SMB388]